MYNTLVIWEEKAFNLGRLVRIRQLSWNKNTISKVLRKNILKSEKYVCECVCWLSKL